MAIWFVGSSQPNYATLEVDGTPISTGSATIEYFRHNGTAFLYLQADLTTWATTYATLACAYDTHAGFGHVLPIPTGFLNQTIQYLIRHSVHGTIGSGDGTVFAGGLDIRLG